MFSIDIFCFNFSLAWKYGEVKDSGRLESAIKFPSSQGPDEKSATKFPSGRGPDEKSTMKFPSSWGPDEKSTIKFPYSRGPDEDYARSRLGGSVDYNQIV